VGHSLFSAVNFKAFGVFKTAGQLLDPDDDDDDGIETETRGILGAEATEVDRLIEDRISDDS
jgi:hypothetical protein